MQGPHPASLQIYKQIIHKSSRQKTTKQGVQRKRTKRHGLPTADRKRSALKSLFTKIGVTNTCIKINSFFLCVIVCSAAPAFGTLILYTEKRINL